ncbi:MAG: ATP-binding protein [gamma proteobacterium symbiont of Bathyaustriella thionipta]|nr:ATP-binding protein [gamma proteobacterium symbiont of Bathyaustriella thionipta]
MKSRLHRIEIQNFKAFRDFTLNLEGRHLLVYGPNGSGKSSLYWALYTFLQSARKRPQHAIAKYFDPDNPENLLNIHEDAASKPGEIALTLRDTATRNDTTYRISQADHGTFNQPAILKGNLASDFITYRFFFGFSDFSNSEKFNIWPLFEKEILPFCVSTGGNVPLDVWNAIKSGDPNPDRLPRTAGADTYSSFKRKTDDFATMLPGIVDAISTEARRFYDQHFSADDPAKVTLKLGVTTPPSATGSNQHDFCFTRPVIEFGIQIGSQTVHRPQAFLNEAKLTQLALSVRFAASLVNLHDSDLKLLVLDDLLVSLDMSNRMKVVEILLSDQFDNYQKIILTHDLGFFREFQRLIGDDLGDWCVRTLKGNARTGITAEASKNPIEKARQYINGHDLEEAALQLRKAAEETAKRYRRFAMGQTLRPGEFHSLSEDLKAARKHLEQQIPMTLYKKVIAGTPEEHRDKLVCASDADLDADASLDAAAKGKLKAHRRHLRQFLSGTAWQQAQAMETIDAVIRMKDRVLNPAAHWGEAPLYQAELDKALKLVARLEKVLK